MADNGGMVDRDEIKRRREKLGLTLRDAASKAGWGETGFVRWSRLENGTPKDPALSTLESVARVLKCKLDDIVK
jgi:transcriptional regulator with XRE-family HTH domain